MTNEMTWLDRDIQHLETNLKTWGALYDKHDLARAKRMLNYIRELKKLKRGTK